MSPISAVDTLAKIFDRHMSDAGKSCSSGVSCSCQHLTQGGAMIEEVDLSGTACFAPGAKLEGLKKVNFIFGPNGSGKTTLSTIIKDENSEIAIFNRDYIQQAFRYHKAPGHITLGEDSGEAVDTIERLSEELKETIKKKERVQEEINIAQNARAKLVKSTQAKLSEKRKRLSKTLKEFDSLLPKGKSFIPGTNPSLLTKLQRFQSSYNTTTHSPDIALETILKQLKSIPKEGAVEIPLPQREKITHTFDRIKGILLETITTRTDSSVAQFVSELQLSDWVSRGIQSVKDNNLSTCPFCQQKLTDKIIGQLTSLFDERHSSQLAEIQSAKNAISDSIIYHEELISTLQTDQKYTQFELSSEIAKIRDSMRNLNQIADRLRLKQLEPAQQITLDSVEDPYETISAQLSAIENRIDTYNTTIRAGKRERKRKIETAEHTLLLYLTQIEFKEELNEFSYRQDAINTAEPSSHELTVLDSEIKRIRSDIAAQQAKLTQVGRKMQFINELLDYIGFKSFSLTASDTSPQAASPSSPSDLETESFSNTDSNSSDSPGGQYTLVRHIDGRDTPIDTSTLSEGERTLLTFLYFISKYYDDRDTKGIPKGREMSILPPTLLIIDDPITSTDAETFFLITNIIRRLLAQITADNSNHHVKQVIITSHNTRFLKEVAFGFQGEDGEEASAGFYIISKGEDGSSIDGPDTTSYITNEYNDLWAEVRRCNYAVRYANEHSTPVPRFPLLGNVMRRIIESYFLDIGEKGSITSMGAGGNKKVATLLAFCNSTSHSAIGSDMYEIVSWRPSQLLTAFKSVFETIDEGAHLGHYRMMMRTRRSDSLPHTS